MHGQTVFAIARNRITNHRNKPTFPSFLTKQRDFRFLQSIWQYGSNAMGSLFEKVTLRKYGAQADIACASRLVRGIRRRDQARLFFTARCKITTLQRRISLNIGVVGC